MIRRTGAIVLLAGVAALASAAPAGADHTLSHKIQALTAKLNCLQKYPVFAFADYAFYDLSEPSVTVLDAGLPPSPVQVLRDSQEITALDFDPSYPAGTGDLCDRDNGRVALQRMDNVGIVVESLDAAISFFAELGLELEGRAMIEGDWSGASLDCATSASRSP